MRRAWIPCLLALTLAAPAAEAGRPRAASLAGCRRAVDRAPGERESWGCFYEHARRAGDFAGSAAALRSSLAELGELDPRARGYALLALANLVAELDNAEGIALYQQAAAELERGGDSLALTLTLLNLALRERLGGAQERSAETLRAAERAAAAHGDPRWIATVAVERVRHTLRSSGDLGEASRVLADVEALLFPDGDYQAQVNWLNAAAHVQRRLGRLDQARATHERLIALAEQAGDGFVEASARYNRVTVMLEQARERGDLAPSDALVVEVGRAIEVAERADNRPAMGVLRCIESDLLLARARYDEAERSARRCADAARSLGDPRLEADGVLALLDVLLVGEQLDARADEAEALLAEARAIADAGDDPWLGYGVATLAAELRWRRGPREAAIRANEAVLAALERLRVEQSDPLSRAELLGALSHAYARYVDELLRAATRDDDDELIAAAFEVAERGRARVLLETLRGAGAGRGGDPALRGRFTAVQRELAVPTLAAERRAELLDELAALERRELADDETPALPAEPPTLAQVQARLGPREALLAFQLANPWQFDPRRRGSWVLVVTRDSARAVELAGLGPLRARVELFESLVRSRSQLGEAAASLGAALLADALAGLPEEIDTLTLILDGPLHRLPFAALRPAADAPALAERYSISAAPSAAILSLWRGDAAVAAPGQRGVLALADPTRASAAAWLSAAREPDKDTAELAPLPFARREAALAGHGPDDLVWLGADASEAALARVELGRFAVLHFATHALIDEGHPSRSAIVLARAGEADDGLLQPRELAAMELRGKLVILSACSSVGDRVIAGEGVMGLAHALFDAGARAVVGGLWELRDDETLALFERFYAELDGGSSVAEALAEAQRERAAAGAEPAAWAGVVVLGDGSFVPFPGGRRPAASTDPARAPEPGPRGDWRVVAIALLLAAAIVAWRVGERR